jgi:sulfite reductase (NADPH) flavoprotein alpha-component
LLAVLLLNWQPAREVSALLIVTAYLGVCLLIWSRQRRDAPVTTQPGADSLLIAYASQGGQARELAVRSAEQLRAAGIVAELRPLNALDPAALAERRRALFIVSTYGEGEAPDNAAHFERRLSHADSDLSSLEFALLALGDLQYRHFCGFGRRLDAKLRQLGAQPLFDRLEVDRADAGTLRHWQHQLGHLSGHSDFSDWQPAPYQPWRLDARRLLNPGSLGAPIYQLTLCPAEPMPQWRAGDIAEIGPRHQSAEVERLLKQAGLDPEQVVASGQTLAAALGSRRLPSAPTDLRGLDIDALLALPPLPHREYSIASTPAEGRIELLVREARHADGRLGLGSGWLCHHATLGGDVDLRVRSNPGFHGPEPQVPMILIGNGTGLAGLRAHLRERAAAPASRNWLLFGERSAAHDQLLHDELQGWLASGHLQRLDLAFSRDQAQKIYVQHLLRDAADDLRQWIAEGASLYVCGSLEGMGREVQQILCGVLGEGQLRALAEQGRYRRDLY